MGSVKLSLWLVKGSTPSSDIWLSFFIVLGTRWRSWFRSRKVAGSIPYVIEIFHWHNPFGRPGVDSEMSARSISWGVKAAGA
jgi:hypothetical protein